MDIGLMDSFFPNTFYVSIIYKILILAMCDSIPRRVCVCVHVCISVVVVLSHIQIFATLWTIAHQALPPTLCVCVCVFILHFIQNI